MSDYYYVDTRYVDTRVIKLKSPVLVRDLSQVLDGQPNGAEIIDLVMPKNRGEPVEVHLKLGYGPTPDMEER